MKLLRFLFLVGLVCFVACASTTVTSQKKIKVVPNKRPPLYNRPVVEAKQSSPSISLVNEGIQKLENKQIVEAEWKFEEAINLDPDYGPAYYWLARARYRLEEVKGALNLLERAEVLLKASSDWLERINEFRDFLLNKI